MSSTPDNHGLQPLIRTTKIVFAAIVASMILLMFVALIVNQVMGPLAPDLLAHRQLLIGGLAIISFTAMVVAKMVYIRDVRYAKEKLISDTDKLTHHRSALIKYLAICEFPAIAGAMLFMLTGNFVFLVFTAVLLGFILALAPSGKKLAEELMLDWKHRDELK